MTRPQCGLSALVLAVGVLAAAGAWVEAAKTDINVQYDKTFSFAGMRTWAWHPEGPGDTRLALTAEADPKRVAARADPVIIPAVEKELGARGFTKVADKPDLYVHYYVLATIKQTSQQMGQFLPAVPEWGLPPFSAGTQGLSTYPVGTLLLDISSPAQKVIVWRGSAARKLDFESADGQRRKNLENAIRDVLTQFPPKK
jgi:hypothetical protein